MTTKIIDVSSHNGNINWNEVANDGVSDVIIRLSLGYGDKDVKAQKYAKKARLAGINVSYYHLAYPDTKQGTIFDDVTQEANYFSGLFQARKIPNLQIEWLLLLCKRMSQKMNLINYAPKKGEKDCLQTIV